ncbi:MAG: hypothetical protein LBQ81_11240, partial [Zoogloeaceae bacterium]|nr:hypothetical protein [Zoogloeaceae bacterium]
MYSDDYADNLVAMHLRDIEEEERKKAESQSSAAQQKTKQEDKGFLGHVQDLGASALSGAIGLPESFVGLADIVSGGRVGKFLENEGGMFGFRPKEAREFIDQNWHTDQYRAQQQEFQDAGKDEGFWGEAGAKAKTALQNPSLIANTVVESLPLMLGGAGVAKAGLSGVAKAATAAAAKRGATEQAALRLANRAVRNAAPAWGAAGEGITAAGSAAEQFRQESEDGLLSGKQAALAALSGVGTGALGFMGGKLAQKWGIADPETLLAGGIQNGAARSSAQFFDKNFITRMTGGAISEGVFEELPQSLQEQVLSNLAQEKPWNEELPESAVMGILSGGAMGAGANIGFRPRQESNQPGANQPPAPNQPPANQNQPPANQNPVPEPISLSEQMGINPSDGPMSEAAALAVDSGASPVSQAESQEASPVAESQPTKPPAFNGKTNESELPPPLPVMGDRGDGVIGSYGSQEELDAARADYAALQSKFERQRQTGERWAGMTLEERNNAIEQATGKRNRIQAENNDWNRFDDKLKRQLADVLSPEISPLSTEGNQNGNETPQTLEAKAQRTQTVGTTGQPFSPGREQKTKDGQTTEVDKPVTKPVTKPVDNQNPVTSRQEKADESNQTNEKGASNVETAKTVETGTERAAQNEASASVTPSEPKPRSSSVPGT